MLAAVCLLALASTTTSYGRSGDLERAVSSYSTLQDAFQLGDGMYSETAAAGPRAGAALWPYSQALGAALELAAVPGRGSAYRADARAAVTALERYQDEAGVYASGPFQPYGSGGIPYYDDNEWVALDLVRAERVLGDPTAGVRAERLFAFVTTGWDRDASHTCPGGVFWTPDPRNTDRNAVTTANGALLALELYHETGRTSYLHWAETMYRWVRKCLVAEDGLILDHLQLDGTVDRGEWSYNQGAMIAAGVELYRATGRGAYLTQAERLAGTALRLYGPTNFAGEPACFVAIFFRDLRVLAAVRPDRAYTAAAERYADARWHAGRDRATGLFEPATGEVPLLEQAAMVQLYADLATS